MHKSLEWARKQGLDCEQEIMAETLRQLCRLTTLLSVTTGVLLYLAIVMTFK